MTTSISRSVKSSKTLKQEGLVTHEGILSKGVLANSDTVIGENRRRGRGAVSNSSGRFEALSRHVFDDGWQTVDELPAFKTEVQKEQPKTIISTNRSPDLPFDKSINPYRGCEHGCVYCYARPSHSYVGLSAGLDFESRLFTKPNAPQLLTRELSKKNYQPKVIVLGSNTDAYQPIEREWRITRQLLEILEASNHPVAIITKSALVLRDIDILQRMASKGLAKVVISITSLDRRLCRTMEPRAATPGLRLKAIHELSNAGIPVSMLVAPVIPALNDHEIERILDSGKSAGASSADYVLLRLPLEVSPLFREWLLNNYPGKYRHVMNLIRSMRGGKDYDAEFGKRMSGKGPYAWQIKRRFELARKRLGLIRRDLSLDSSQFIAPKQEQEQLTLF